MKFSFKRFLSSALAAVMTVSVLSVGMVSSVSAADPVTYPNNEQPKVGAISYPEAVGSTSKNMNYDFTKDAPASNFTLHDGDKIYDLVIHNSSANGSLQMKSAGNINFVQETGIDVPVPVGSSGNIAFIFSGNNSGRKISIENGTAEGIKKDAGNTFAFTSEHSADGFITLMADNSSGDRKLEHINITLTSDHTFDVPPTYTLSGACTGLNAGDTFVLTDGTHSYTVEADGNGAYNYSTQGGTVEAGKYTAVLKDYVISYAEGADGVTIAAKADSSTDFTATPAINFVKLNLEPLAAGVYNEADAFKGLPNFDTSAITQENKINDKETLGFKVNEGAKVTVKWHTGTSETTKGSQPSIRKKGETTDIVKAPSKQVGAGSGVVLPVLEFSADNLAAGEYVIYSDSPSTSTRINEIIVEYPNDSPVTVGLTTASNGTYAFAGIDEDEVTNYDSIDIYVSNSDSSALGVATNGKVADTTTTVYGEVADVATPAEVSGKKVFAVLITGTPTKGDVNIAAIAKSATNGNVASSNIVTINAQ